MTGPILVGGMYLAYHLILANRRKRKASQEASEGITLEEFLERRR